MGFRYQYKLNGEDITEYVSIGQSLIEKLEEPLDDGSITLPFTMRNYEYPMRGLLEIGVKDSNDVEKNFTLLIYADVVEEGSKYGEWIHTISILEYTHIYDNYLFHTLTITKGTKNDRLARFLLKNNINVIVEGSNTKTLLYKQPYVEVKEVYETGTVVFNQTAQAKQYIDSFLGYVGKDVYLTTDAPGNTEQCISDGDVTFNFTTPGRYKIIMRVDMWDYAGSEDNVVDFIEYYIRVVNANFITVKRALEIIRDIKPFESLVYHAETRLFDIDPSIADFLDTVEIPQLFIQKATMRQVLNSVFRYVNAISRAIHVQEARDVLTADFYNKRGSDITFEDIIGYTTNQDAYRLFNKGVSWLEQALPDDLERANMKTPGENYFKTVRSKDIQLLDNNFKLPLEKPIYEIKRLSVVLDTVTVQGMGASTITYNDFELDLTSRLLNREEWNLKLITNNFPVYTIKQHWDTEIGLRDNRASNLYWQQGQNYLDLSVAFGEVVQATVVKNTVEEALEEYFTLHVEQDDTFRQGVEIGYTTVITSGNADSWRNLRFNVEYITVEDITIQTERDDVSYSQYYTEGRLNQDDKRINTMLMSRKIYGDIQRSGVPNITIKRNIKDFSELYGLGDRTADNYVIVQRKYQFHNEFIQVTYNLTKDHNRLNERTDIDTHYRAFEIPQSNQVYERQEHYSDYIFITNPNEVLGESITKIKNDYISELIFGVLRNDWLNAINGGKTKVSLAYVRTDGMVDFYNDGEYNYGVTVPVTANGIKQGLAFTFGFEDTQIVGDALKQTEGNIYNNAVRYTNEDGTFNTIWFSLARAFEEPDDDYTASERLQKYPLIRTTQTREFGSEEDIYFSCGSFDPLDGLHDALVVIKDQSQSFKMTYQATIMAYKYYEYVIGQYFYNKNFLVSNPTVNQGVVVGETKYLYIYTNGTKYDKFDDLKVKTGWATQVELDSSNMLYNSTVKWWYFTGISLSSATSWAIGDEDGNLYLACNFGYNGFKEYRNHFRYGINQIGNKEYPDEIINYFFTTTKNVKISDSIQIAPRIQVNISESMISDVGLFLGDDFGVSISDGVVVLDDVSVATQYSQDFDENINVDVDLYLGYDFSTYFEDNMLVSNELNISPLYQETFNENLISSSVLIQGYDFAMSSIQNHKIVDSVNVSPRYEQSFNENLKEGITLKVLDYEWRAGGTTPTVNQQCSISAHEGNVRCSDYNVLSCSFVEVDAFFSGSDLTTTPSCAQNATKYTCTFDNFFQQWLCYEYRGVEEREYFNCEICTEVEVEI